MPQHVYVGFLRVRQIRTSKRLYLDWFDTRMIFRGVIQRANVTTLSFGCRLRVRHHGSNYTDNV